MYFNGEGIPKNDVEAYAWFNIVAARGESDGEEYRKRVATSMTLEQIGVAQKLAQRYWKSHVEPFGIDPYGATLD